MGSISGGALLAKVLKNAGVKYVFGIPGGQLFPFMDAISRDKEITFITTRHEENAAHMADAVTRLTGTPAVCFGTTGSGATNMFPGVAAAYQDSIPVIAITPNNQSFCVYPHMGSLQDGDHLSIFNPVTKWNAVVNSRQRITQLVSMALNYALNGRPGPVHLDFPVDVLFETMEEESIPQLHQPSKPRGDPQLVARASDMLKNAQKPLLVAGGGVVRSGAWDEFREVASLGIPATTTPMGDGCVDVNSGYFFGTSGWLGGDAVVKALSEADLLVAVGCRFSSWLGSGRPPICGTCGEQKIIQVDIEGEIVGQNIPVETGITSDAGFFLQDLKKALAESSLPHKDEWEKWGNELANTYKDFMGSMMELADNVSEPMNEATVLRHVTAALDEDTMVMTDGGQVMQWVHTFFKPSNPQRKLFTAGIGHLGVGLPFANAAKMLYPGQKVVNITGDGSFAMTSQELETALRYGINSVTVVLNDRAWGMIKAGQVGLYNNPAGVDLSDLDFTTIAKGFGAYVEKVHKPAEIKPALERAFNAGKPALIEIPVQFTSHPSDRYWMEVVMRGCQFPAPPQGQ